ncbi:hypothetical protein [Moorena sp. SIO4G3]|uniref:hypothetical protein n=1 Tax=Moorena sp. SIO4G3 TaxID=2607821 RepID=UPI0025F2F4C8|nr:hypothetical protein [Moorena sp. SIO4G3]
MFVLTRCAAFNGAQTKIDQWHNEWVSFERKFAKIKPGTRTGSVGDVLNYAPQHKFANKRLLASEVISNHQ